MKNKNYHKYKFKNVCGTVHNNQKNEGITLIALIITIIVILILVAVTVRTIITGGLFGHAKNATQKWADEQNKEKELGDDIGKITSKYIGASNIYSKLYKKSNGEEILIFSNNEDDFPESNEELFFYEDYGNICDVELYLTEEDLYEIPEIAEELNSEEWKKYKEENPEEARETIQALISDLNASKMIPWIKKEMSGGDKISRNTNLVEVRILNEITPIFTAGWFHECYNLKVITGIENLNTSKVTTMRSMFEHCDSLTDLDLSNFDTSEVTDMGYMFHGCESLVTLDFSSFNTSKVTDMTQMFCWCNNLTDLDLSNFNTSNVKEMWGMFMNCWKLTSLNVSSFDTSNVTSMLAVFDGCSSLLELDLSSFDTSNVTGMNEMFNYCSSLTELDLSNFKTSNVTAMSSMFEGCESLTQLNLSSFDTSLVWNMEKMFRGCGLKQLDLRNFNTSEVAWASRMFDMCENLNEILVGNEWNLEKANKSLMFNQCGVSNVTYVNE